MMGLGASQAAARQGAERVGLLPDNGPRGTDTGLAAAGTALSAMKPQQKAAEEAAGGPDTKQDKSN
jgi:hypothetical protein